MAEAAFSGQPVTDPPPPARAPAYLLVLCGLPGAGKSRLCMDMMASVPQGIHACHVCFDGVEAELEARVRDRRQGSAALAAELDEFDAARWRQARLVSFDRIRSLLSNPARGGGGSVVLVDDNMHYRSMRRQCLRLARDCRAAYAVLHVSCGLQTALRRNGRREGHARLAEELIRKMHASMEVPGGSSDQATGPLAEFGHPVVRFDSDGHRGAQGEHGDGNSREQAEGEEMQRLWAEVLRAWGAAPPQPLLSPEERIQLRAAGQAGNAASAVHTLDLRCRTAIGAVVSALAGRGCSGAARGRAAGRLNEQRRRVLDACRSAAPVLSLQEDEGAANYGSEGEDPLAPEPTWMERLEAEEAAFGELCDELKTCPEASLMAY